MRPSRREKRGLRLGQWALALFGAWLLGSVYLVLRGGGEAVSGQKANKIAKTVANSTSETVAKAKKKHRRHHHKTNKKRRPTMSPTSIVPEAVTFPFNRERKAFIGVGGPRRKRTFRVGPRKDLENFVAPLMRKRLGMTETRGMDWQVYIGLQFKSEYEKNYALAPNDCLVSSIPGLKQTLGDKAAFSRLWRDCLARARQSGVDESRLCGWTTPSYNLAHKPLLDSLTESTTTRQTFGIAVEGGVESFMAGVKQFSPPPSTWIVKPQNRYLSLGMHLATLDHADLETVDAIAAWARREVPPAEKKRKHHTEQPGEFTMQQYVDSPGLVGQRKFDLRLWVLITSLEPLEVYLLDVGFPKISVVDYKGDGLPRDNSTLSEKCMHILMMASEFCTKVMKSPLFPFEYPGITRPDISESVAHGRSFLEHFQDDRNDNGTSSSLGDRWRRWQLKHWPELERLVLTPILLAREKLQSHEARIFGAFDNERSRAYNRVALLSPDAIWDARAGAWRLEEINTNGLFQLGADEGANVKTFHVDEGYTEGWLRIAGADGFPESRSYRRDLDARLTDFLRNSSSDYERRLLERAAHRHEHASGGWYRIFPPVDCSTNCGEKRLVPNVAEDELFDKVFQTELSDLAKMHWTFLRSLDKDPLRRRR